MLSFSKEYDTDIITLFHLTGDFNYRSRWQEGVKSIEEVNHMLPRVGMRCRCIMENGEEYIYASSYSYHPDKIEFSETDEKKKSFTYYTLEKISAGRTKLTIDYYLKKNIPEQLLFKLLRKNKMEELYQQSLENLDALSKEVRLTGAPSPI